MSPEEVVRAFLDAEGSFSPSSHLLVPQLRGVSRAMEDANRAAAVRAEETSVNVKRLTVRIDGDVAVADLNAFIVVHIASQAGPQTLDWHLQGPVYLQRLEDEWLIADFRIDGVTTAGWYRPVLELREGGLEITIGGVPVKVSSIVVAGVLNKTNRPVRVDEFGFEFPAAGLIPARWCSRSVPAIVAPGERWGGTVSWVNLSVRREITAVLRIDGREVRHVLHPSQRGVARRRRLRPFYGFEAFLLGLALLALISSVITGTLGLLGIFLSPSGTFWLAHSVRARIAGFASPWSDFLGVVGLLALGVAGAMMVAGGFGVFSVLVLIGSLLFALQGGFRTARAISTERARRRHELD